MPVVATSNEERFTKIFPHLVRKKFRATVPRPNAFSWGEHFTRNCEKWVEQIPPKMRSEKTDADESITITPGEKIKIRQHLVSCVECLTDITGDIKSDLADHMVNTMMPADKPAADEVTKKMALGPLSRFEEKKAGVLDNALQKSMSKFKNGEQALSWSKDKKKCPSEVHAILSASRRLKWDRNVTLMSQDPWSALAQWPKTKSTLSKLVDASKSKLVEVRPTPQNAQEWTAHLKIDVPLSCIKLLCAQNGCDKPGMGDLVRIGKPVLPKPEECENFEIAALAECLIELEGLSCWGAAEKIREFKSRGNVDKDVCQFFEVILATDVENEVEKAEKVGQSLILAVKADEPERLSKITEKMDKIMDLRKAIKSTPGKTAKSLRALINALESLAHSTSGADLKARTEEFITNGTQIVIKSEKPTKNLAKMVDDLIFELIRLFDRQGLKQLAAKFDHLTGKTKCTDQELEKLTDSLTTHRMFCLSHPRAGENFNSLLQEGREVSKNDKKVLKEQKTGDSAPPGAPGPSTGTGATVTVLDLDMSEGKKKKKQKKSEGGANLNTSAVGTVLAGSSTSLASVFAGSSSVFSQQAPADTQVDIEVEDDDEVGENEGLNVALAGDVVNSGFAEESSSSDEE